MPRRKKNNFSPGPKTIELISNVTKSLEECKAAGVDIGELIDEIIDGANPNIISKFVAKHTPMEFRLKSILSSETAVKDLEKLIQKHERTPKEQPVME